MTSPRRPYGIDARQADARRAAGLADGRVFVAPSRVPGLVAGTCSRCGCTATRSTDEKDRTQTCCMCGHQEKVK